MFFFLSAISLVDYYRMHKGNPSAFRWIFWGFFVPALYGGGIELLQKYFFTSRRAEWGDWIADILGSLAATLLVIIFFKKR
jgi:VanZ family protein